jgi:hypothetical protein
VVLLRPVGLPAQRLQRARHAQLHSMYTHQFFKVCTRLLDPQI